MKWPDGVTTRRIYWYIRGTLPTTAITVQLLAGISGKSVRFTIPPNVSEGEAAVSLVLAANESLVISHFGGGTATDIEFSVNI